LVNEVILRHQSPDNVATLGRSSISVLKGQRLDFKIRHGVAARVTGRRISNSARRADVDRTEVRLLLR
jgi:hypothetical protein